MLAQRGTKLKVPVLFPEFLQHSGLSPSPDYSIVSAGFAVVRQDGGSVNVEVDGHSTSLQKSHLASDAAVIADWLELGTCGAMTQLGVPVREMIAEENLRVIAKYPMAHRPVSGRRRPPISAEESRGDYGGVKLECLEDEELVQNAIEVIRSEQKASCALLQRRLHIGYFRALCIMEELEFRRLVGPRKGTGEPRDVLIDPQKAKES